MQQPLSRSGDNSFCRQYPGLPVNTDTQDRPGQQSPGAFTVDIFINDGNGRLGKDADLGNNNFNTCGVQFVAAQQDFIFPVDQARRRCGAEQTYWLRARAPLSSTGTFLKTLVMNSRALFWAAITEPDPSGFSASRHSPLQARGAKHSPRWQDNSSGQLRMFSDSG